MFWRKHNKKIYTAVGSIIAILSFIIIVAMITGTIVYHDTFFDNREAIISFLSDWRILTPVIFVLLTTLSVVITPLSYMMFALIGGFLFGPIIGTLLNWLGKVIGITINFYSGRSLRRSYLRHHISRKHMRHYDAIFRKNSPLLIIMYALPFTSPDVGAYLAGASKIKPRTFFVFSYIGSIFFAAATAYIGNGVSITDPWFVAIASVTILGSLGYVAYSYLR